MSEKLGRIFVSYSTQDTSVAEEIVAELKKIGLAPWIDREQIKFGESFIQRMNEGLAESSYVILLMSQASLQSRYVTREWMSTLTRDNTVLIPVKIAPCEVPALLRDIRYVDLSSNHQQGVAQLINFFRKELGPATSGDPSVPRSSERPSRALEGATRREFRLVCMRCLDETQFKAFLHDADIPEGRIGGASLHDRILNLLHVVGSDGILQEFTDWLVLERPACIAAQLKVVRSQPRWQI